AGCTRLGDGRVVPRALSHSLFSLRLPQFSLSFLHTCSRPSFVEKDALSQSKLGRLQVRGWRRVRPRGEAHQVSSRRCPSDEGGTCGQATTRAPSHLSKTSETTHRRARASSRQFTPRQSRPSSSKRTEVYLHLNSFGDADLIRRELIDGARWLHYELDVARSARCSNSTETGQKQAQPLH
ncbi:hypothetical protein T492DRAFT_898402, partial [Pavlovales sp. CCMP2436]